MVTATVLSASGSRAFEQQVDAAQALVVRAGNARQPLVGLPRPSVQRDLDRERPPLDQVVGDPRRDQRAVGEERDQKPLLLRVGVDVEEIAPREDLAAGEEQPQAAGVGQLVENAGSAPAKLSSERAPRDPPSAGCCSSGRTSAGSGA